MLLFCKQDALDAVQILQDAQLIQELHAKKLTSIIQRKCQDTGAMQESEFMQRLHAEILQLVFVQQPHEDFAYEMLANVDKVKLHQKAPILAPLLRLRIDALLKYWYTTRDYAIYKYK